MQLNTEVFPAPFGPINPSTSPCARWKLTSRMARTPPNLICKLRVSSSGELIHRPIAGIVRTRRHPPCDFPFLPHSQGLSDQSFGAENHQQNQNPTEGEHPP